MPSPSKPALLFGIATTMGIYLSGAWFASTLGNDAAPITQNQAYSTPAAPITAPVIKPDRQLAPKAVSHAVEEDAQSTPASTTQTSKPSTPQPLQITIEGARNAQGTVFILVFDDKSAYAAYDYTQAVGVAQLPASTSSMSHTFEDLTTGPYAIGIFHDENNNEDFDMSEGYPLEGYGTSRAKGPYDDPSFKEASVMNGPVTIKLHYLK